ncbi:unnamed protein product [Meloidogyne enterolobii]|uniref:Uncharacterized protein n=1 Tax=Meloidogyne enterolobii TaxID=390850 RepID=A0ACB0ZBP3_MELEN
MDYKDIKKIDVSDTFSWNDGDTFGCGIVYPPTIKSDKLPYLFFTQNGKQIGKALLLTESQNSAKYEPIVLLKYSSAETNFGKNLKAKPFIYDI